MLALAAGSLSSTALFAGTPDKTPAPVAPAPETPFVTGNVTVLYETHFISYGQDVWGGGSTWKDALVHPSIELDFDLGSGWQAYLNTWADVNDLGTTNIGKDIQEIDLNVGLYYTMDKWKFQFGYGAWNYASQVEDVLEGKVSYTGFYGLNPFLALHGRVSSGTTFSDGLVTQVGIGPGFNLGPVGLSFPVTVSFDTNNYHGGSGGFAYVSGGISASLPLTKHISLTVAGTYYHTEAKVFPGNPNSDFVLGSAGFSIAF